MTNEGVGVLAKDLEAVSVPMCPMLRPAQAGPLYPVQGYCILGRSSGGFMIPSIAEFREFCSGSGFAACPWFGSAEDGLLAKHGYNEQ